MPSIPSLEATIYVAVNLYWLLVTAIAWSLFCALSGYLYGYLRGRPKFIVLRDSEIEAPVDLRTREQQTDS